jgi:hypothetical protein
MHRRAGPKGSSVANNTTPMQRIAIEWRIGTFNSRRYVILRLAMTNALLENESSVASDSRLWLGR